ncbi:hypothetical protein MMC29_004195, partial [Sticta canariensis]|nr:hypothetical protein [Sticta canariensis]
MSPIFSVILWAIVAVQLVIAAPASLPNRGIRETELHLLPLTAHSLYPANMRRQNSWAGKALWGAIQGGVTAEITMISDKIAVELTGNDKYHPHKSDHELEEERRKKEQEEEEAEQRKKVEEDE